MYTILYQYNVYNTIGIVVYTYLLLYDRHGYTVVELPVNWTEVAGSKLIQSKIDIVFTSLTMARDIVCLRLCYMLGIWH